MSYCRFSEESDVYMYPSAEGIECCACLLEDNFFETVLFETPSDALDHIYQHESAGHAVPLRAITRLLGEIQTAEGRTNGSN